MVMTKTIDDFIEAKFQEQLTEVLGETGPLPKAWTYPFKPLMMQKYTSVMAKMNRGWANWSGTGAGKSHSAILAAMIGVDFKKGAVVVLAPNSILDEWAEKIKGGWGGNIRVSVKDLSVDADFYVLNYEYLQNAPKASKGLHNLIKNRGVQMAVIDEIHNAKLREESEESKSTRRRVLEGFLGDAGDIIRLALTATPLINNIKEVKSILELVTGKKYDDISDRNSRTSFYKIYQQVVIHGQRDMPKYSYGLKIHKPELEMTHEESVDFVQDCRSGKGKSISYPEADKALTKFKTDWIINKVRERTQSGGKVLIYTYYVTGIIKELQKKLQDEGFRVGTYWGEEKSDLDKFKEEKLDVLIGSSSISTGIDGLQNVCSDLIFSSLPYTDAEFQQTMGRLERTGRIIKDKINIWIPMVHQETASGNKVSVDVKRLNIINSKGKISKAAIDGKLELFKRKDEDAEILAALVDDSFNALLDKIVSGDDTPLVRDDVDATLVDLMAESGKTSARKLEEFSLLNRKWNKSKSSTTNTRLTTAEGHKEWVRYHEVYSEARKSWSVVPAEVLRGWVGNRKNKRIADLGCGQMLMDPENGKNEILGFDHVAHDDRVTVADISNVPLEDGSVDIAVLSLALMGSNYSDYISEARRIIDLDGYVWIAETLTHVGEEEARIKKSLESYGLNLIHFEIQGKFAFMRCTKLEDVTEDRLELLI